LEYVNRGQCSDFRPPAGGDIQLLGALPLDPKLLFPSRVPATFLSTFAVLSNALSKNNKSNNSKYFAFAPISLQTLQLLLMGAKKYYFSSDAGCPSYTPLFAKFRKFQVRIEIKLYCFLLLLF